MVGYRYPSYEVTGLLSLFLPLFVVAGESKVSIESATKESLGSV